MGLKKCPKCELNYIQDDEKMCYVCKRAMVGERESDEELPAICLECGERPAVRGSELCALCLKEKRHQEKLEKLADEMAGAEGLDLHEIELDEIDVPITADIPESELEEIDKELGNDSEPENVVDDGLKLD